MPKISQLPQQASPTTSDKVPLVSGGVTDYALISDLITVFFNNIPAGAHSDVTRQSELWLDCVASGLIWTGDSYAVNRNASMTSGVVYINGRRISISAVTSRTFTASKDTYVDILDNLDGTGTIVYTEVANGASSPSLASNSIRIAKVVTGATTIAAATSIVQGGADSNAVTYYPKSPKMLMLNKCHLASGNNAPNSTAQTFTTAVGASYQWNEATEVLYDPNALHSISSNPSRITIKVPGIYKVDANLGWPDNTTGTRIIDIYKNGVATFLGAGRTRSDTGGRDAKSAMAELYLAVGDYVELSVFQDSGGNLQVQSCTMSVELMS